MSATKTRGWRARMRRTRGGALLLKLLVFLLGALFVGLGLALIVLPGPLTIPPVLLGVYIWSTEFDWAERLRERVTASARDAWEAAKRRPIRTALASLAGVVLVVAAVLLAQRYDVVDRVKDALG